MVTFPGILHVDSGPQSERASIVDTFPPELLLEVAKIARIEDQLALKLSCMAFHACLPHTVIEAAKGLDYVERFQAFLRAHLNAEKNKRKHTIRSMVCTFCGKVRQRELFADKEAQTELRSVKWLHDIDRYCVPCSFRFTPALYAEATFAVKGRLSFACGACHRIDHFSHSVAIKPNNVPRAMLEHIFGKDAMKNLCTACADNKKWTYVARKNGKGYVRVSEVILRWGLEGMDIISDDQAVVEVVD